MACIFSYQVIGSWADVETRITTEISVFIYKDHIHMYD